MGQILSWIRGPNRDNPDLLDVAVEQQVCVCVCVCVCMCPSDSVPVSVCPGLSLVLLSEHHVQVLLCWSVLRRTFSLVLIHKERLCFEFLICNC